MAQRKRRDLHISAAVVIATGVIFACGKTTSKPTPPAPRASAASSSSSSVTPPDATDPGTLPLELNGAIYDPVFGLMNRYPSAGEVTWPPKDAGGWFRAPQSPALITLENNAVVRKDPAGKMIFWRTPLQGSVGGARPPHALISEKHNRVVITVDQHLVGLDFTTGKKVWEGTRADRGSDRLLIDDDLVFATSANIIPAGSSEPLTRVLVARKITDGTHAWTIELPGRQVDPHPISKVTGVHASALPESLFIVGDSKFAWFFTRDGKVPIKLADEEIIHAEPVTYPTTPRSPGLIVLTSKRIVGLGISGNQRWELAAPSQLIFMAGGGATMLPDGDAIIFNFAYLSDSGVELRRIHPLDGSVVYHAKVDPLGVAHSQYSHSAYVRSRDRGAVLDVVSIGAGGTFVESRNADDGKLMPPHKRWQPNGKMVKPEPSTR